MGLETDRRRGSVSVALSAALTAATEGNGSLTLLLGEAGIGKTTTARDLAAEARRGGVTVRWSACWSGGGTVAHAPWLTVLSGLGTPGRRAMEVLLGTEPGATGAPVAAGPLGEAAAVGAARASAYAAVVAALDEATTERPALLVVDDLHWADEGTLQLLDVVAAHAPGLRALVVGTYRDTDVPAGSPLTRLGGSAERFALGGLDRAGIAAVLRDHVGASRAGDLAEPVEDLTGGNPFLVSQLGRLLATDPEGLARGALPAGTRDLLQQRLGALRTDDRAALAAAAVLGSPFRAVDVEHVLAGSTDEVASALDRAAARRVVERAPGTGAWAFVHDLFRQATLDGITPGERAALHRAAGVVARRSDAEPAVVARHLLAAGDGAAAAAWSVRAGDRALAAMAWEEAASHHERALAALPPGPPGPPEEDHDPVRPDALAGLGRARLLIGDEQGATQAFDGLAAIARARGSAELLARAALGFSADLSGFEVRLFDQHQIDLLEEADRALAPAGAPGLRATVRARLSVALSLAAPDDRRRELAESAVELARAADEPIVLARALAAHCDAIAGPADGDRRLAESSEIIAIAEAAGDGPLELLGRRLRYVARLEAGDIGGVEEDTNAFARRAAAIGNPLYSWYLPLWRAQLELVAGDVDGASALVDEAEALGRAAGSTNGPMLATVLRLAVRWQRGDYAGAVRVVETLDDTAPELTIFVSAIGSYAWAYTLADRPAEAISLLDRVAALGLDAQVVDAEWLPNLVNLVRSAATHDHPILAESVARLEPHADRVAFEGIGAGLYGSVARIVAVGCSALGRHDDAVRHARAGLAANRGFGGILVAHALRTLARCLAARGDDPGEADAVHTRADAAYAAVGATHLLRPGSRGPADDPAPTPPDPAGGTAELRHEGEVWHVAYGGASTIVKHSKGLADLAVLLARPGHEVHVTELEGIPAALVAGDGGEAVDRRALAAYKERLGELAEELDDAEAAHDLGRAERARVEYDALVDQLAGAVGLGGRPRSAGPQPVERLRKAVSARVRDAIRRIGVAHPPLGRHLSNAVRTGVYCSYQPEVPTTWRCRS